MTTPQPGDTWVNPYGRAFRVDAINVRIYGTDGELMGIYAELTAKDNRNIRMAIYMRDLTPQTQMEMLL